jgi:hypothetical protein
MPLQVVRESFRSCLRTPKLPLSRQLKYEPSVEEEKVALEK